MNSPWWTANAHNRRQHRPQPQGFYDGLLIRAEDFYILQPAIPARKSVTSTPAPSNSGESLSQVPDEDDTLYNQTFEDVGLFQATPVLPFATLGTLGWAHSDQDPGDGSSQFFMFLYEAELTPAGLNLVDGRNAAFGYVVDGFDVLEELGVDDKVVSIKVIDGADRLQAHA